VTGPEPDAPWDLAGRLTGDQRGQIERVLAVLESDEHAPTSARAREQALRVHVMDSLVALELEAVRTDGRIIDLGSGAGFPGVGLAIALPRAQVSLVESQGRKCEFLRRLCAAAELENVRVIQARAEEWSAGLASGDVALARALAAQPVVLEYAAPLLRVGGTLVDWRGRRERQSEQESDAAAAVLGLRREQVLKVHPFAGATDRHLHVFVKVQETPARFPRRAGVARKRPLGG
jgi:16S rRNA (guanine527-N7)-methyltransferase